MKKRLVTSQDIDILRIEEEIWRKDINEIVEDRLRDAGLHGRFPTSAEKLARRNGLNISSRDFGVVDADFHPMDPELIGRLTSKVRGVIDVLNGEIYINRNCTAERMRFTSFHEIGHGIIPWQKSVHLKLGPHFDSQHTLSAACSHEFEMQANYFSACAIFQGNIFSEKILGKSLSFLTIREIASQVVASAHATAQHFIKYTDQAGILLRLEAFPEGMAKVYQYFQSPLFREKYPREKVLWGKIAFDQTVPFVQDFYNKSRNINSGYFDYAGHEWKYDYFYDRFNHFVLVTEPSEGIML